MTTQNNTGPTSTPATQACDRASRLTKSLLGYGVIAGPAYVLVSLTEALTRDGFDLTRHSWSLLSNGDFGWVHITNLVLTGLMTVAFAIGLRRALGTGHGATWVPWLIGGYGLSLVAAGAFRADPALGFPAGTPVAGTEVTWHGTLHLVSGALGFACLIAACLVLARRFAAEGRSGWAAFSLVTGVLFLAGFAGIASGTGSSKVNLAFTAAVVLVCGWMSAVATYRYRRVSAGVRN